MMHLKVLNQFASKTVASLKKYNDDYNIRRRVDKHRKSISVDISPISLSPPPPSSSSSSSSLSSSSYDVYCLQDEFIVDNETNVKIVRVFIRGPDSGDYSTCGWVVNQCVNQCMICKKSLITMFSNDSHHCRACGNIVCSDCSHENAAVVEQIIDAGKQLCCVMCFYGQEGQIHAQNNYKGGDVKEDDDIDNNDTSNNTNDSTFTTPDTTRTKANASINYNDNNENDDTIPRIPIKALKSVNILPRPPKPTIATTTTTYQINNTPSNTSDTKVRFVSKSSSSSNNASNFTRPLVIDAKADNTDGDPKILKFPGISPSSSSSLPSSPFSSLPSSSSSSSS